MNHRSAIGLFIVISLALLLAIPTVNLSDRKIRQQVWALAMERDAVKLKNILFNRDWLGGLQSRVALPFGISTNPASVIVGTGGWLFLGDQENRNTSAQRYAESDRDARIALEMGHNLLAWEAWLHAQGVRGVAWVVGPDKHPIYNQHLPGVNLPGVERFQQQQVSSTPGQQGFIAAGWIAQQAKIAVGGLAERISSHRGAGEEREEKEK